MGRWIGLKNPVRSQCDAVLDYRVHGTTFRMLG